jgi:hypothetical protein
MASSELLPLGTGGLIRWTVPPLPEPGYFIHGAHRDTIYMKCHMGFFSAPDPNNTCGSRVGSQQSVR